MALIESIGDPTLTVGLSFPAFYAKVQCGEVGDLLRWSQTVIDLADGDPSKGRLRYGVPVGGRLGMTRGRCPVVAGSSRVARRPRRRPGHGPQRRPDDPRRCRRLDLRSGDTVWVLRADDRAVGAIEEALQIAEVQR